MYQQEFLEEHAPILLLSATTLTRDPQFYLDILEITTRRLLLIKYRYERDHADSFSEAFTKGKKAACYSEEATEDLLALVNLLAGEEHLEEALLYLEKALEHAPNNGEYHRFKMSLLERQGKMREALDAAKKTILLLPNDSELQKDQDRIEEKLLARLYHIRDSAAHRLERLEAAREIVTFKNSFHDETILAGSPPLPASRRSDILVLVRLLMQREAPEEESTLKEALFWINQLLDQEPAASECYYIYASLLVRSKEYLKALLASFKAFRIEWKLKS